MKKLAPPLNFSRFLEFFVCSFGCSFVCFRVLGSDKIQLVLDTPLHILKHRKFTGGRGRFT